MIDVLLSGKNLLIFILHILYGSGKNRIVNITKL